MCGLKDLTRKPHCRRKSTRCSKAAALKLVSSWFRGLCCHFSVGASSVGSFRHLAKATSPPLCREYDCLALDEDAILRCREPRTSLCVKPVLFQPVAMWRRPIQEKCASPRRLPNRFWTAHWRPESSGIRRNEFGRSILRNPTVQQRPGWRTLFNTTSSIHAVMLSPASLARRQQRWVRFVFMMAPISTRLPVLGSTHDGAAASASGTATRSKPAVTVTNTTGRIISLPQDNDFTAPRPGFCCNRTETTAFCNMWKARSISPLFDQRRRCLRTSSK